MKREEKKTNNQEFEKKFFLFKFRKLNKLKLISIFIF